VTWYSSIGRLVSNKSKLVVLLLYKCQLLQGTSGVGGWVKRLGFGEGAPRI
jgi:hypothetical protein